MKIHGTVEIEDVVVCPNCNSKDIVRGHASTTLVGWSGGLENDPNHHKCGVKCKSCDTSYTEHWVPRSKSYWVVNSEQHVVIGEPTCCETIFTIACECGGKIAHNRRNIGQHFEEQEDGSWGPKHPMYWQCNNCDKKLPDKKWGKKYM